MSRLREALLPFVRASTLHVGAAAASVSLRADLVRLQIITPEEFDRCYALARLTPGTNLLALYTALGYRIASWWGAVVALVVGTLIPALIVVALVSGYVAVSAHPFVERFMAGAKAGALGVLLWAVVRLARPFVEQYRVHVIGIAVASVALAELAGMPPFVVLLLAGGVGALVLSSAR